MSLMEQMELPTVYLSIFITSHNQRKWCNKGDLARGFL